jgi:hypothetical protein
MILSAIVHHVVVAERAPPLYTQPNLHPMTRHKNLAGYFLLEVILYSSLQF